VIINNSHQFVFIHIPKNAGTSIARYYSALSRLIDIEVGATALGEAALPHIVERHGVGKHAPFRKIRRILSETSNIDSYFSFAFVRNPYERTISTFSFLKKWLPRSHATKAAKAFQPLKTVNDMLQSEFWQSSDIDNMFKPQTFWVTDADGKVIIDFWGKVESICEDIATVNERIGVELPAFDISLNRTRKAKGKGFLTNQSVEILQDRYSRDFELFDYPLEPSANLLR
jgi:hypothetical protein